MGTTPKPKAPKQGVHHRKWLAECASHDRTRAALLVYLIEQERGLEALRRELRVGECEPERGPI